jgi:hydroxymethylbilane synthase
MPATPERLVIATRQSRLALWQSEHVRARLLALYPRCSIELLPMSTRGDQVLDRSLAAIGGKGLFIKELEQALVEGRADLAVHSCKDVPMELPAGFALAAFLEREDPRDAFLSVQYASLDAVPAQSLIGTSSLRREAQLRHARPDLRVAPLRGNVESRLRKLQNGEYDAIILAAAGLRRLGLTEHLRALLPVEFSLPAVGQGALAIEIPEGRADLAAWLAPLNHAPTALCVRAERAASRHLGGSCTVPLAAHARLAAGGAIEMEGLVARPDGQALVRRQASGPGAAPEAVGEALAKALLEGGAGAILQTLAS